ncbi:PDZ domain-containing protein [Streptomyces sp. NPDC048275]|uniref:PDZ domain-containing protein n=1 Tax=Streptomyces sp. NPDC048275 TaxID=3155629 RepID=UPI0033CFA998
MEQTALRPKPMPGQEPGGGRPSGTTRRPHAARRRGKRLTSLLFGLFVGTVLVLSGVGLGTVGATVIGMSKLADLQKQATGAPPSGDFKSAPNSRNSAQTQESTNETAKEPAEEPAKATLALEVVDVPESEGALVVGVHVPGPGYTAGLVRGDVLLAFGDTRVWSAADLARAVASAHPGSAVTLTVRRSDGERRQLSTVPGIVT